ncbi:MAG TPA: hypothetical protein V6C81_20270 [Planktothrix sp.]
MIQGSVSTIVDATAEHIFRVLVSKIDTKALNRPEPSKLKVMQRHGEAYMRERTTEGQSYTERINIDNSGRRITYTLIDHPYFEGYISEQLLRSDNQPGCILAFTVDWRLKDEVEYSEELPDLLEMANDELFHIKEIIEKEAAIEAAAAAAAAENEPQNVVP